MEHTSYVVNGTTMKDEKVEKDGLVLRKNALLPSMISFDLTIT